MSFPPSEFMVSKLFKPKLIRLTHLLSLVSLSKYDKAKAAVKLNRPWRSILFRLLSNDFEAPLVIFSDDFEAPLVIQTQLQSQDDQPIHSWLPPKPSSMETAVQLSFDGSLCYPRVIFMLSYQKVHL